MAQEQKLIDIEATIEHETEKALLLDFGEEASAWVPKSVVEDNGDGTFTMPYKWAFDKGMI